MTAKAPVFLYGTLCDPDLFGIVSGVAFQPKPAKLAGHAVAWVKGENFPILTESAKASATGALVHVDTEARARLDFYELGFGYNLVTRRVDTDDGQKDALVYLPPPDTWSPGLAWSLADWQSTHGPLAREAAREYMRLHTTLTPAAAARAFPQVRMRAASRLRAGAHPSPAYAHQIGLDTLQLEKTAQPYTDYFAVQEDILRFPRFDGSVSAPVKRATFLGGDAVTVLPYDPSTNSVLVVRQFRHGAYCRGDTNPWTLEPAAGRIDPGESPEETARRELLEETGVKIDRLVQVGQYYPSPGAYSEFIYSYVAQADLSGVSGGIGGLEDEAEDIMSHVIPLPDLLRLIETGAANTAPLILSALWLAANRDRLPGMD